MLAHALHRDRTFLYSHATDLLSDHARIHYGRYLNERLDGKPTQYITGLQEFYGREFLVSPDVLIPRPETEHLVEAALEHMTTRPTERVVDVGTGSGAIAISIAAETSRTVFASDISIAALAVASRNNRRLGTRVEFHAADLLNSARAHSLDLVVSNPPYIPGADSANMQQEVRDWEPHVALFAGTTGLEIYGRLISQAEGTLKSGGCLIMELGYRSLEGVRALLAVRWMDLRVVHDLAGWPRTLIATLRG